MKKLFFILIALFLVVRYSHAQTKTKKVYTDTIKELNTSYGITHLSKETFTKTVKFDTIKSVNAFLVHNYISYFINRFINQYNGFIYANTGTKIIFGYFSDSDNQKTFAVDSNYIGFANTIGSVVYNKCEIDNCITSLKAANKNGDLTKIDIDTSQNADITCDRFTLKTLTQDSGQLLTVIDTTGITKFVFPNTPLECMYVMAGDNFTISKHYNFYFLLTSGPMVSDTVNFTLKNNSNYSGYECTIVKGESDKVVRINGNGTYIEGYTELYLNSLYDKVTLVNYHGLWIIKYKNF